MQNRFLDRGRGTPYGYDFLAGQKQSLRQVKFAIFIPGIVASRIHVPGSAAASTLARFSSAVNLPKVYDLSHTF